jgi:hypothetical protein
MATGIPVAFFPVREFTMLTFAEAQYQFIGLFGQTARYHHGYKVFLIFSVRCDSDTQSLLYDFRRTILI